MVVNEEVTISEDEAALYDRQIRLWGLDAQKRLRAARILLVGLGGLGAEIAKNLTLAGIKTVTLLDHRQAKANSANFLLPPDSMDINVAEASHVRVQRLNPMVKVVVDKDDVSTKPDEYFTNFDVVCCTRVSLEEAFRINNICRKNSISFYSGDVFGFSGYFFVDLLEHEYAEEINVSATKKDGTPTKGKSESNETKTVKQVLSYIAYKAAYEANPTQINKRSWKRIQHAYIVMKSLLMFRTQMQRDPEPATREIDLVKLFEVRDHIEHELKCETQVVTNDSFEMVFGELSPAAAVVGGVLAQEIIKAVSHKDMPICNYFFFNGLTDRSGLVEAIGF